MIRKSNTYMKNIYVSLFILIAIYSQTAWYIHDGIYYTVFLSCAVTTGFYVSFGREVLPGIILTSIIGVFAMEILVSGKPVGDAALYTLPLTFLNVAVPFIFKGFLTVFKVLVPRTLKDGFLYILAVVLTVCIVSVLPAIQMAGENQTDFFVEYLEFIHPMSVGMTVFTIGIILSNYYDDYFNIGFKGHMWDILFFITFVSVTYGVFSGSYKGLDFMQAASIFILFFIINAYQFSYRMLLINSWMYIGIYNLVYFEMNTAVESISVSSLNIYLIILTLITIFTKVLIYELRIRNNELEETKERYEDMVSSTLELFKVRETLSTENVEHHETVMKNIFDISLRIFHKIEYATCNIRGIKHVKTIDTKGYNLSLLQGIKLESNRYSWNNAKPIHYKDGNKTLINALGDRYKLFEDEIPNTKESISILIKLSDEEKGAITFDIVKGTENHFTNGDIYNIGAFQSMINSFYEMNELTIKNNNLRDDIVLSLIRTLELFDHYTGGHSEDVAFLASILCKELKLPANERYDIYWAGIVHDIGKIGINSDIINKKGKLTLHEYKQVQQHPNFGYEILVKSEDLKKIAKLVKHHHEWFNGSGYPDGLEGNDIPLGSQILQVADSVSSMATRRSYQNKKTFDEIIEELEIYSGTQFNPKIAKAMIKLVKEGTVKNYFKSQK